MQCVSPFVMKVEGEDKALPCGHCRACRIRRSAEWTVRLYHESLMHDESLFVTLTYNDENLPDDGQLKKSDFQNFMKKLRNELDSRKIKYYGCGEYGDKTKRPHYHAIIYGLGFAEHTVKRFKTGKRYPDTTLVQKGPLRDSWTKGNVVIGTVTTDSIRYVCDYIQKKLYGRQAKESGKVQPFSLMSKGLGLDFALKHKEQISDNQYIMFNGVKQGVPRYYAKKLGIKDDLVRLKPDKIYEYDEFWRRKRQDDKVLKARENLRGDKG